MTSPNLSNADRGDMQSYVDEVTIDSRSIDAPLGNKETEYLNNSWSKWFGIYYKIAEVKQILDLRAMWVCGAGYDADIRTNVILDRMRGNGNRSFLDTLMIMTKLKRIGGDSFAHIIKDAKGNLLNIKVLDPSSIKIIYNSKGIIIRYEQINKVSKKTTQVFQPSDILHFCHNPLADSMGGTSDIEAVEDMITALNEAFQIGVKVIRYHSKPKLLMGLDEGNAAKRAAFIKLFDETTNKGDNLFYELGTVKPDVIEISTAAITNILAWRNHIKETFYQAVNTPQLLSGFQGGASEANGKVTMTAHSQTVKWEQLYTEIQVKMQLNLDIKLRESVSLTPDLQNDFLKDGSAQGMNFQPSELAPPKPEVSE